MRAARALYASGPTDRGKAVQCQAPSDRVQDLFSASATRPSVSGDEAPQKLKVTFPGPESTPKLQRRPRQLEAAPARLYWSIGARRDSLCPLEGAC